MDLIWQPIDTAPKAETRILLTSPKWGGIVVIGWWSDFHGGVWFNSEDEGGIGWGVCEPMHWMPLPELPSEVPCVLTARFFQLEDGDSVTIEGRDGERFSGVVVVVDPAERTELPE